MEYPFPARFGIDEARTRLFEYDGASELYPDEQGDKCVEPAEYGKRKQSADDVERPFDAPFIKADGSFGQEKTLAENVYASFLMHPGEFYFLNAGVDLQKYQTRWYL